MRLLAIFASAGTGDAGQIAQGVAQSAAPMVAWERWRLVCVGISKVKGVQADCQHRMRGGRCVHQRLPFGVALA